ncbi:hypothetical protein MPLB_1500012 [Mesorhizobium sp. ORS 3324]|nr:hypothetical protein MPLB_1500012 [Mesorhizobium sp. ORS 3324]
MTRSASSMNLGDIGQASNFVGLKTAVDQLEMRAAGARGMAQYHLKMNVGCARSPRCQFSPSLT